MSGADEGTTDVMKMDIKDLLRPFVDLARTLLTTAKLPGAEFRLVVTVSDADLSLWMGGLRLMSMTSPTLAEGGGS